MTTVTMHLPEELLPALEARGLRDFDTFLNWQDDAAVSRRGKRPVRPLTLTSGGRPVRFYLKQFRLGPRFLLTEIWKRRLPVLSATRRELEIIRLLQHHRIPVMAPVAWGERRCGGLPTAGFLLVAEVQGEPFTGHYQQARPPVRRRLRHLHGSLVGELHRHGILTKVRPRDLIVVDTQLGDFRDSLVVIDRERGLTHGVRLSLAQRARQLADVWCKSGTELGLGSRGELRAFLAGYFRALGTERPARPAFEARMRSEGLRLLRRDAAARTRFDALWKSASGA